VNTGGVYCFLVHVLDIYVCLRSVTLFDFLVLDGILFYSHLQTLDTVDVTKQSVIHLSRLNVGG